MNDKVQVPVSHCCSTGNFIALLFHVPVTWALQGLIKRWPMSERAFSLTEQKMKKPRRKRRQRLAQVEQDARSPRWEAKPTSPALFLTALCVGPGSSPETRCVNEATARDTWAGVALVSALRVMHKMGNYMQQGVAKPYCKAWIFNIRIFSWISGGNAAWEAPAQVCAAGMLSHSLLVHQGRVSAIDTDVLLHHPGCWTILRALDHQSPLVPMRVFT